MDEIAKEKKVCVTGASGYIASWLVKLLLQRGYTVNATVRNPNDSDKTEHLLKLEGAKERLHFFKANLIEEGSFDSAIVGCEGVFHTASPVVFSPKDPQVDLLDPAIKGTLNILASCKKFPAVRRVVLTSSMATSTFTSRPLTPDVVVDETWFSDPELCKGSDMMYYVLSKVLAEEAAWKYAKENDIDMVSINFFVQNMSIPKLPLFSFLLVLSFFIPQNHAFSRSITKEEMGLKKQHHFTHLHFYWHDYVKGPNLTARRIAQSSITDKTPSGFGALVMFDDPLTVGPEKDSKIIGYAQGMYGFADLKQQGLLMIMNFVFVEGEYNGSTISVLGRNQVMSKVREMGVVGGSGVFRSATGYAQAKTITMLDKSGASIVDYNVYVQH